MKLSPDEVEKNAKLVVRAAHRLRVWVGDSTWKYLLVYALALVAPVATGYIYLNYLLYEQHQQVSVYIEDMQSTGDAISYENAIDAISSCVDSAAVGEKLHSWYCEQAVSQYRAVTQKRSSTEIEKSREKEVIGLSAYLAMRDDVRSYLRDIKLRQERTRVPTNSERVLNAVLSNTVEAFFILLLVGEAIGLHWFFRLHKPQKHIHSDA